LNDPDLQQWLLAPTGISTRLRELRGSSTGRDFAGLAGMRPAKLSKLELAQQMPTEDDIRQIVAAASQPATLADELIAQLRQRAAVESSGKRRARFGQVANQKRLNDRIEQAKSVRLFETTYVPRVVQDAAYATHALTADADLNGSDDEPATAADELIQSTKLLHDPDRKFLLVLAEPILYWQPVEPALLRRQLERLLSVSSLRHVSVRILPMDVPLTVFPPSSFALYDGEGWLDSLNPGPAIPDMRLAGHVELMADLERNAASVTESKSMIRAAVARLQ
jgi:transcriptional regulator with XRE-family HTH domain